MAAWQALYRKYRPRTFDEVVGQPAVSATLKKQVQTGRISHAYLFTGSRGTGKTSCAKILSRAVNCLQPQDGNPCNCCAACRGIEDGSVLDVLEIDAASNNGVDNVRALRTDAIYAPASVRKRVYIIDEVHMLSQQAFNALLKIIEEPPAHLIFILATTELQKVPATILSRCQRFSFRRILPEDIVGRLQYVAGQEGIALTPGGAQQLARLADGGLRDALSLLDQCASAADGPLDEAAIDSVLGLAGEKNAAALMRAIADQDAQAAMALFQKLYAGGRDVAAMLDELCALSRDLLLLKTAPGAAGNMLSGAATDAEARALADRFTAGELLRITALLQQTASGFAKSANRRIDAELCLLQLCAPDLHLDLESLNARLGRVEAQLAAGVLPQQPAAQPAVREVPPEQAAEDAPPPPDDSDAPPEPGGTAAPAAQRAAPAGFWPELVQRLRSELPQTEKSLFSVPDGPVTGTLQGDTLLLTARDAGFTLKRISQPQVLEQVSRTAAGLLGRPVRVKVAAAGQSTAAGGEDPFQQLLDFSAQHENIIRIED